MLSEVIRRAFPPFFAGLSYLKIGEPPLKFSQDFNVGKTCLTVPSDLPSPERNASVGCGRESLLQLVAFRGPRKVELLYTVAWVTFLPLRVRKHCENARFEFLLS